MVTEAGSTTSSKSITQTLGVGSGVDTVALVTSLVEAQFAAKNKQLTNKETALTAQISSIGNVQSGISGFASALTSLVKGGSLVSQPVSSNVAALTASALPGAKLSKLSASVVVTRLATSQSATTTTAFANRTAPIGTGTLTLTFGRATVANGAMTAFTAGSVAAVAITIDSDHQSVDGIAKAINAAAVGITATTVTDIDGTVRLSLKGGTGTDSAFTLRGDTAALAVLDIGVGKSGTTIGSSAGNAALSLDGVAVERGSNSVSDLIDGVRLNLITTTAGEPVTLSGGSPTTNLSQAVNDMIATFNQLQIVLKNETNAQNGPLRADPAATALTRSLRQLTLTRLVTGAAPGAPTTLAEIGIGTNRDGSLNVNATQLAAALAKWPESIEAMFADGDGASGAGIGAALTAISAAAADKVTGLGASAVRYGKARDTIVAAETKAADDAAIYKTRLTKQFAGMEARVAAYKSTQDFLKGQIDAWNNQNN